MKESGKQLHASIQRKHIQHNKRQSVSHDVDKDEPLADGSELCLWWSGGIIVTGQSEDLT